jgi:hypothetical protein
VSRQIDAAQQNWGLGLLDALFGEASVKEQVKVRLDTSDPEPKESNAKHRQDH